MIHLAFPCQNLLYAQDSPRLSNYIKSYLPRSPYTDGLEEPMATPESPNPLGFRENDEPLINSEGIFICGRESKDGTRCNAHVSLPHLACWQHDRDDPII